jgi:riboflavin biosynthesis pyrimidine reductase
MVCGEGSVDPGLALDALAGAGLARVLCEGGPTLFWTLLDNGLVDEACLTFSPVVAGAGRHRLSGELPLRAPARFELHGLLEGDGLLLARYGRA